MSVVEDVRGVVQDFLAPELRELKSRVDALEKRMEERFTTLERNAELRHEAVLFAIRQLADYNALSQRVAQLEAGKSAH